MALPDLIEIVPPQEAVQASVTVPGSKSITNRALVLAALSPGETTLRGALWSEDTQVMVECLQELGFMVNVGPDPAEACNRTITVYGKAGRVPRGGTAAAPVDLFVGNAGTAARFLSALVCLGQGAYRLSGVARMHERPQQALFEALRELSYRVDAPNDRLPALIHGSGSRPGKCSVSIRESSQFASALLLCAEAGGWQVEVQGENPDESPYVKMTIEMLKRFPRAGGTFQIEADASSGSYFVAAGFLLSATAQPDKPLVKVLHWPDSGWQADEAFPAVIQRAKPLSAGLSKAKEQSWPRPGADTAGAELPAVSISRRADLADSIMTAIVLAPFSLAPVRFSDLGRLRVQECERVSALRTELSRCGARVVEEGDTLTVQPSLLRGAEIETYNDHRMAMCFATLGLRVPGIKIRNPACVKKTFPDFYQKLALAPPAGLGSVVRHGLTGREIPLEELFAD